MRIDVEQSERPRFVLGATPLDEGTRFALWSPETHDAAVRFFASDLRVLRTEPLENRGDGYFVRDFPDVEAGALYKFLLDGREVPDPWARFLPFDVHGAARVEPRRVRDSVNAFTPVALEQSVIYEIHLGTFTPEGTWAAAIEKLPHLAELGVTTLEIMPIAAFAGSRGWGYDGVAALAPFAPYGSPSDVCAFVDAAHARGLSVVLDVVLNHFGPSGNYLPSYAAGYFTSKHKTAWGDAPNFVNPYLRALCLEIARTWLVDYAFDGLRLDATHAIVDDSKTHILTELADFVATLTPKKILIAEDERNEPALVKDQGLDAVWADDFHHVVHIILTGEHDGYYAAYEPSAAELARVIERGWLYEGQIFAPTGEKRGKSAEGLDPSNLIYCLQNHDQIGNRAFGRRLHKLATMEAQAAAAMLMLFLPTVPMIFMGEEWGATKPFLYFTDHEEDLGKKITLGRRGEFAHFAQFRDPELRQSIPDPQAAETFLASKLDWAETALPDHRALTNVYRKMLQLRARDDVMRTSARPTCDVQGSLLVVTRTHEDDRRTLLFNTSRTAVVSAPQIAQSRLLLSSFGEDISAIPPCGAALFSK